MQRFFYFLSSVCLSLILSTDLSAQVPGAEAAPLKDKTMPVNTSKAIWELNSQFSPTDQAAGDVGMAGIAYLNNEFWISRWASDTLYRFSKDFSLLQEFVIPGLNGTRAITTDGTWLYMSNNTAIIYQVDPVNHQLTGTQITSQAAYTARYITYDPTLDNGNGGFWTGTFNSDITSISMSGQVLSVIPAATHTLPGIYGIAFDNVSREVPTLWAFYQGGLNTCQIDAINLPDGTPAGISHDVFPDVMESFGLSSGLAGGAFFSADYMQGKGSLMGLIQGTPKNVVFSYTVFEKINDAEASRIVPQNGYTQIPVSQLEDLTFEVYYKNNGNYTAPEINGLVSVLFNDVEQSSNDFSIYDMPAGEEGMYSKTISPSGETGSYKVTETVSVAGYLSDQFPENNETELTVMVTDSVMARDNGVADGTEGFTIQSDEGGLITSNFTLGSQDTLSGIWIRLVSPVADDTTYAVVYSTVDGLPSEEMATGKLCILEENVFDYYLTFEEPVTLAPGTYAFGCHQGFYTNLFLVSSEACYTPASNYVYTAGNWSEADTDKALFIRPVFGKIAHPSRTGEVQDKGLTIYPVPADEQIHITLDQTMGRARFELRDLSGKLVDSGIIERGITNTVVPVGHLSAGMYLMNITDGGRTLYGKIVIR
ncbi:MAG: T9SS type A sorting domain-containing protein [Bacteroidota bacterium]